MAKYLITGIAGFIGSSLARALVERGEQVRGVDNYLTGKAANLAGIEGQIDFREADLRDAAAMRAACEGIDYILHIGALPSVPLSVKNPEPSHRCNVDGTFHVLEGARAAGVKRIIYAASSSAYGDQPVLPSNESMRPMPISPYAVQKLAGEYYMNSYWQVYGLETVSLRYFNVFGPRQGADSPYSGVLAKFIQQMLVGTRPTIFGNGEQGRDFTYIENIVSANLLACAAPAEKVAGKVFNTACGGQHTLKEIYQLLAELTGFDRPPLYAPPRTGAHYDSFDCAEPWARKTLMEHARDRREHLYSIEQLERCQTHDELWNAAQNQMVKFGWMHNYMRMYWAKKILEWSPDPARAFDTCVTLNDRYFLDGRDPNGYAGIAWSIVGKFDRPWFERPIFGTIRYMSAASTGKKFNSRKYIQRMSEDFTQSGFWAQE